MQFTSLALSCSNQRSAFVHTKLQDMSVAHALHETPDSGINQFVSARVNDLARLFLPT